jgi:hypothetical protein
MESQKYRIEDVAGLNLEGVARKLGITFEEAEQEFNPKERIDNLEKVSKEQAQKGNPKINILTETDYDIAIRKGLIPASRKNKVFDKSMVEENISDHLAVVYNSSSYVVGLEEYTGLISNIIHNLQLNILPKRSFIIGAPPEFGKSAFVYECLTHLSRMACRTVPYLTLLEIGTIRKGAEARIIEDYRKKEKEYAEEKVRREGRDALSKSEIEDLLNPPPEKRYTWTNFLEADVLFCALTSPSEMNVESQLLYDLVTIRGDRDLPTIVTTTRSISQYQTKNSFVYELFWRYILNASEKKWHEEDRHSNNTGMLKHVSAFYRRKDNGMFRGVQGI